MTRKEAVKWAEEQLLAAGIADAGLDARYLFYHVTGLKQMDLLLYGDRELETELLVKYQELLKMRVNHVPLQYLTGTQEFMGMEFAVTPDVLIPRQDTECLVEAALPYVKGKRVLDVCTGSGCIIISLARLGKPQQAVGCDLSADALEIAKNNAKRLQAEVEFRQGDLFEAVESCFDVIVSNPPYIESRIVEELMPEVRCHEPRMALDGDADGLSFYRRITRAAVNYLFPGGHLFFEIGCEQAAAVTKLMQEQGFEEITCKKDYAGLDRVLSGRLAGV